MIQKSKLYALSLLILLGLCSCADDGRIINHTDIERVFEDPDLIEISTAAATGDVEKIKLLLDDGVNINTLGNDGITPLAWALLSKNKEGIKFLLAQGANPNLATIDGYSIVGLAARMDDSGLLKLILNNGGDPNFPNKEDKNETPIFQSINKLNEANIETLIKYKADLNWKNQYDETPIMLAGSLNRFDIVLMLLKAGADYKAKDRWGNSIIYFLKNNRSNSESIVYKDKVEMFLRNSGVVIDE